MSHVPSCFYDSFVCDFEEVYIKCVNSVIRLYFVVVRRMFEFHLRSTLLCLSFKYFWFLHLGIHSDCALPIWASPVKYKWLRPIYCFFKSEKFIQTQEIREIFTNFCLKAHFQAWLRFDYVFITNKNKQNIYTNRYHNLPGQLYLVNIPSPYSTAVFF